MEGALDVEVSIPPDHIAAARERFEASPKGWLGQDVRRAVRSWQTYVRLGRLHRPVLMTVGLPHIHGTTTWRRFTWVPRRTPPGGPPLVDSRLPSFRGYLGLQWDADQRLILRGGYDPPGGRVGSVVDNLLLHKVAELTGSDLLDDIVHRLCQPVRSGAPS